MPRTTTPLACVLGKHPRLKAAVALAKAVAPTQATVLILGETGTGKGILASAIHAASHRAHGKFVSVNCGALPPTLLESELFGHERGAFTGATAKREGKFEAASGGTIFLDEIDSLSPAAQAGLLNVIQERKLERLGSNIPLFVDARIVVATNRDLATEVRAARFREDLFYRLNVVPIHLPPLRERIDDVEELACHFVREHAEKLGRPANTVLSNNALAQLATHSWPGNVRELENVIMRALILGEGPFLERVDLGNANPLSDPRYGHMDHSDHRVGQPAALDLAKPHLSQVGSSQPFTPLHFGRPRGDPIDLEASLSDVRRQALDTVEACYLRGVLRRTGGDVERAARHAQLSRRMFYQLLRRYGIRPEDYRAATCATNHRKEDSRCIA